MKFCIPEIHGQGHDFDVPIDDGAVLKDIFIGADEKTEQIPLVHLPTLCGKYIVFETQ